jgi:hypothetical protein
LQFGRNFMINGRLITAFVQVARGEAVAFIGLVYPARLLAGGGRAGP